MATKPEIMEQIHELLSQGILDLIEAAKDREEPGLTAAEMNAISKFLKDNGIEAVKGNDSKAFSIVKGLPFPTADSEADVG